MAINRRQWIDPTGKLRTSWVVDVYIDEVRHRKGGFARKTDAQDYERGLNIKEETKDNVDKTITFKQATIDFMHLHAEIHCKQSTTDSYKSIIKLHLIPFFKNKRVHTIKPENINEYIKIKLDEKLGYKTINNHVILLSSIFEKMIENNRIVINPVSKIKKLRLNHIEMQFLNVEELNKLLQTCKIYYKDFYPILFLTAFTGIRRGELIALTWDDINLNTGKLSINKSYYRGKVSTPKTPRSIRKIDLISSLTAVLKEYKLQSNPNPLNLLFTNKEGHYLDPDNMVKRRFNPCLRKAGINEKIRFHDLRHTYASLLIAKNVPIKYIQSQMGHSSIQVTLDRYGHIMPDVHDNAVNVLEEYIEKEKATKMSLKHSIL